jgi:biopolymer transport protein ExbD
MPPKTLFRLGLSFFLFALAVYFSTGHWVDSRIFVPLDYPVSLDASQIRSPPFQINLRETYFASLDLDYSVDDWYQDNRCNYKTILYPQWRLYKLGSDSAHPRELWVSSEQLSQNGFLSNAFLASPGRYQLEWDIPAVAPCLNPRHPRLLVFTDSSGYREAVALIQLFCIFLGGTAFALIALATAGVAHRVFSRAAALRMFPDMVLRSFLPITKHAPLQLIHDLPHWGLFCGAILWVLIFIFMIIQPLPSQGLIVGWRSRDAVVWEKSPWSDTLNVYVRIPSRFFINGQEVERSALRAKLLEELSRRAEWSVYFEADSDTLYMDAVYAVDTIQGCGAKLIWVTPKMREEWRHQEQSVRIGTRDTEHVRSNTGLFRLHRAPIYRRRITS